MTFRTKAVLRATTLLCAGTAALAVGAQEADFDFDVDFTGAEAITLDDIEIYSYEEAVLQALGVSTVTEEQLEKTPVANDISEVVRKMPGVNLTGTSATGQRGNQRQIDIRGMGPENTLILIDGKPVMSRNSVRMGRSGERDTRGDSNWVPAEMIERIEVIRGPAAARYGSGAAGGVVNIVTKAPEVETVDINLRYNAPQSSDEGGDRRVNLLWAKPLGDQFSFRLTGGWNRSDADAPDINAEAVEDGDPVPAGMEGVENKDVSLRLSWTPDDMHRLDVDVSKSRQSNIYAGDRQLNSTSDTTEALAEEGAETNRMERLTLALTHRGTYDFGRSNSYVQWEKTDNSRYAEGLAGGGEGRITDALDWVTIHHETLSAKSEWILSGQILGRDATHTFGGELRHERLEDAVNNQSALAIDGGTAVALDAGDRQSVTEQTLTSLYAESNILWGEALEIAPSIRVDHAESFGLNLSAALNMTYMIDTNWTAKFGVARAFKAPNLYQVNPDYVYTTNGNGCPYPYYRNGPCYVLGNEDLDPETSINTEVGLAYDGDSGLRASATVFYNDYRDKIQAGTEQVGTVGCTVRGNPGSCRLYRWDNVPKARVAGIEGNVAAPLGDRVEASANFTYMLLSEQEIRTDAGVDGNGVYQKAKTLKIPLSLVPDYTINASLDWRVTDRLTLIPSLTHYGRIQAAAHNAQSGYDFEDTDERDPYTVGNLAARYELNDTVSLSGGVTNLFSTQVMRSGEGANTFNEPGRAWYAGLSATF
ncbi:FepA family TonB-dependent siderophore receptor [Poseidonocella sedimentorum]|uniref:Outer membrane receptor for ferrienterochelin and colicins n=1 Tax=Poseidonocella sedimentorum TaxID=871652 RepID=A0A1I6CPW4_9RHOB|nr:FepA family TonB-dependent siderophore receptor [Poseidonocella sedimentorum]SFQ95207.1 outer membrane receptor for ferrienterochelin and colicins [Poseidonocella sedimentorum]